MKLSTRAKRKALSARKEQYWELLSEGVYLGYSTKSKCWYARIRKDGKYRKQKLGPADDLGFGMPHSEAVQAAVEKAQSALSRRITIGKAFDEYLRYLDTHRKSARNCKYVYNAHIKPVFAAMYLDDLEPRHLREWLQQATEGLKGEDLRKRKQLCNKVMTYFKAACTRAWRNGYDCDPRSWQSVERFSGASKARIRHLSADEIRRLMGVKNLPAHIRELVISALQTGARYSELARLRSKDFDGKRIFIEQSKSAKSRHIPLSKEGVAFFTMLQRRCTGPDDQLIPGDWNAGAARKPLELWAKEAHVDRFTFHELRHTYASRLLNNGASPSVVAKLLGHADTKMVDKHYGHLYAKTLEEQVEQYLGNML